MRLAEQATDDQLRASAAYALGNVLHRQSRHAEAQVALSTMLELAIRLGDESLEAAATGMLGNVFRSLGRLTEAREHFERAYLQQQLALCGGRVGKLAERVGMERTHLYRKLRALGVDFRQGKFDD